MGFERVRYLPLLASTDVASKGGKMLRCACTLWVAAGLCLWSIEGATAEDIFSPNSITNQAEFRPISIAPTPPGDSLFVFGGQFAIGNMGQSLNPFVVDYEANYIIAAAYEHDLYKLPYGFVIGIEIGAGYRFGTFESGELWGGGNLRHSGLVFFNTVRLAPGITVGFSAVTDPMGIEATRASLCCNRNAHFLGYLGPELAIAFQNMPNLELVYRLHHRSGAKGTFGNMSEGANANVFGVRYRF